MKIATFNANSIRSRAPIMIQWLHDNQPDVLCIQETKVQDHDFPTEQFERTGYKFIFKGQKKYNGVAIFAKQKITQASLDLDDKPDEQARFIKANINGITIVNTYVPQGTAPDSDNFQYKLKWFERLHRYFKKNFTPTDPIIWTGDLNVALTPADVYEPDSFWGSVCYCRQVQDALNKIIDWGFTDLFRKHCPDPGQYTFWDYRIPNGLRRNLGWRLDYILATKNLAKKCSTCSIDKEPRAQQKPSDHTFLIAEFDI